ncbi:hypothetical protein ACFX2A_000597 [Malus domestica]
MYGKDCGTTLPLQGLMLTWIKGSRVCYSRRRVTDCTAYSLIYDLATDTFCPLFVASEFWSSSGALEPNRTLVQTDGYRDISI